MNALIVTALTASLPAGCLVALTDEQAARRAHALEIVEPDPPADAGDGADAETGDDPSADLPDGVRLYRTVAKISFKRGEYFALAAGPAPNPALLTATAEPGSPAAQQAVAETEAVWRAARRRAAERRRDAERQEQVRRQTRSRRGGKAAKKTAGGKKGDAKRRRKTTMDGDTPKSETAADGGAVSPAGARLV